MKKVLAVLVSILLFGAVALAQAADEQKKEMPMTDHQMMMKGDDGKGMMDCPMMKGDDGKGKMGMKKGGMMKHHRMMMHDMMKMMKHMMAIQKKMLSAATPEEKAKMDAELSTMMEKIDKMMHSCHCMMMDKEKPAAGEQKKEEPMPMEHKH